jgi:virginiamycin B lyase
MGTHPRRACSFLSKAGRAVVGVLFGLISPGLLPAQPITEFVIPGVSSFTGAITAGPDGAVWFTEQYANKIGRITTAGVPTEFTIPAGNAPRVITAGPDGALWFAEFTAIGRITTTGFITRFAIPTANSGAEGITEGPDGSLWFTESKLEVLAGSLPPR